MWGGERAHRRPPYTFNRPTASSNVGRLSSPTCPSQHVGRCWMTVSVTYREIAERFGIGVEGARLKAKRRAAKGSWRIVPGNHPQDVVRVEVPEDEWITPNVPHPTGPHEGTPSVPPTIAPQQESQRKDANDLEALVGVISQLTTQAQAMTDRLIEAERGKAEAEKDTAIARAALQETENRLAALQEQHLSQLKALHERMESETSKARIELTEWKARP